MLDKSKRFRKTQGGFDWSKSKQFNFPKTTPEQLEEIRMRIQKDQKRVIKKQIIVFLVIIIALVFLYLYV